MLQWLILSCNQTLHVSFLACYNNLVSQVRDLMRPWNFWKYFSLTNEVYWWNHSHFWWWVLLNRAPTSTQLHPRPLSSFQPLRSSLQHPQQCLNQNIACNWAISPNLGRKIKSYPFWLKIGMHGILTMLILVPTLVFWIANPKSIFGQIRTEKVKSCLFYLKFGTPAHTHTVSQRCWFLFWF